MSELIAGKKILITGGHGFVGRHLSDRLERDGVAVRKTSTRPVSSGADFQCDVQNDRGWKEALEGVDTVVHLAARVHVMNDTSADPLEEFRQVNRDGVLRVVDFARQSGVRRFVFLSSIKVLGEATEAGAPFTAESPLNPLDPYGVSKAEAEEALIEGHHAGDIEIVMIRPPLVYGRGVAGNLVSLARLIRKGIPLPFGAIQNRRDLVGVENLCDLIVESVTNGNASGNRFLVSDGQPVSTPELIREIAAGLEAPSRNLHVPPFLMGAALKAMGRKAAWDRLAGNLEVDLSETRHKLGWNPPLTFEKGMRRAFDSL